jgi:hypothetical protein
MLMRYLRDMSFGWKQYYASGHISVPTLFLFGSLDARMSFGFSVAFSDTLSQAILRLAGKFFWFLAYLLVFIHSSSRAVCRCLYRSSSKRQGSANLVSVGKCKERDAVETVILS